MVFYQLLLAPQNVKPFYGSGVENINPWLILLVIGILRLSTGIGIYYRNQSTNMKLLTQYYKYISTLISSSVQGQQSTLNLSKRNRSILNFNSNFNSKNKKIMKKYACLWQIRSFFASCFLISRNANCYCSLRTFCLLQYKSCFFFSVFGIIYYTTLHYFYKDFYKEYKRKLCFVSCNKTKVPPVVQFQPQVTLEEKIL